MVLLWIFSFWLTVPQTTQLTKAEISEASSKLFVSHFSSNDSSNSTDTTSQISRESSIHLSIWATTSLVKFLLFVSISQGNSLCLLSLYCTLCYLKEATVLKIPIQSCHCCTQIFRERLPTFKQNKTKQNLNP